METLTRDEHLKWAQDRALEYLTLNPTRPELAIASLLSDLNKHPETTSIQVVQEAGHLMHLRVPADDVRRWIEGFA